MRHPAENYLKYLLIKEPDITDPQVLQDLRDHGFLDPHEGYLGFVRASLPPRPDGFDPLNRNHRTSMRYLREQQVYELFYPTPATNEAWDVLFDPQKRLVVEQIILSRVDPAVMAQKVNASRRWYLTAEGIASYRHFFWNEKLLTFDEWGRFLYGRTAMYERHMSLLQGDPKLALFHLKLDQQVESKMMIKRAQEIAYFTLEEVAQKPGAGPDKVKAIGVLTKAITDCHNSLSTSDMALKDVLSQFERFRMEHPQMPAPDIKKLAPAGNFNTSGTERKEAQTIEVKKEG